MVFESLYLLSYRNKNQQNRHLGIIIVNECISKYLDSWTQVSLNETERHLCFPTEVVNVILICTCNRFQFAS